MHVLDFSLRRGAFERSVRILSPHRVIALVGASGAGKTSLLHAIAGLLRPQRGRIEIDGRCLYDGQAGIDLPAHRRRIGYVFQDARLFPHLDVRRNLLYGLRGEARQSPRFEFEAVVDLLGIGALLARSTAGLSGGETQRVALGRALLSQPRILLLDEPLSMLDMDRRDELLPYLQRVRDEIALPMIYVSHYPDEVKRIADEVHTVGD
ncbi:molybdenum ABC transporter ATP-binding protein [Lysobacter silvisoli]|uniref:Molybdenum ABC transporter ATP-binding protein n=1 Tax=Lysobacter silvisoli TaxID=2293254 RepID=A0A371K0U8_9GAMM|nr:molybdenum ABC transporter ATP-binding protein [Lysobacter silvisoli]RDZ27561.1 molybdenum ABC transporter ATP-binding protein [Lysobacter silvisoli]